MSIKGRIFFKVYDQGNIQIEQPKVDKCWWEGESTAFNDFPGLPVVPLPRDATRQLWIWVNPLKRKQLRDLLPLNPPHGGTWGGMFSERVIEDLTNLNVKDIYGECRIVGVRPVADSRLIVPAPLKSLLPLPKYYYLAPPSASVQPAEAIKKKSDYCEPPPFCHLQPYFDSFDVFTSPDRFGIFCTFKVVELAWRKRWSGLVFRTCYWNREVDLFNYYVANGVRLSPDLNATSSDWPPQCVKDLLKRGYEL